MMKHLNVDRATVGAMVVLSLYLTGCDSTESEEQSNGVDAALNQDVEVAQDVPSDASAQGDAGLDVIPVEVNPADVSVDAPPQVDIADTMDSISATDGAIVEVVEEVTTNPWPTNPDKDSIPDPGWDGTAAVGTVMPNFTATDQYGNTVELYDLAMEGKPIVLEIGSWVCEPCKALSWYLSTGETGESPHSEVSLDTINWWSQSFEFIKQLVDEGSIRWVTILFSLTDPMTAQDAAAWHDTFPHDDIVVLVDEALQVQEYLLVAAMPRLEVLDENMVFLVYGAEYNPDAPWKGGPQKGLQMLVSLFDP